MDASLTVPPLGAALRHPVLAPHEELRLARRAAAGDAEAKHSIVGHNLRLVAAVARKYAGPGVAVADLFQEGVIGLMRAVDRYDETRGTRFSTYATWWIRAAIGEAARLHQPIPLPRDLEQRRRRLAAAGDDEAEVPESELLQRTGMTSAELAEARAGQAIQRLAPLDSPSAKTLDDRTAEPVDDMAWTAVRRAKAEALLASLPERDREVLRLRFGFDDDVEMNYREIAERLGSNRETIRLTERRLIRELGHCPTARALRG